MVVVVVVVVAKQQRTQRLAGSGNCADSGSLDVMFPAPSIRRHVLVCQWSSFHISRLSGRWAHLSKRVSYRSSGKKCASDRIISINSIHVSYIRYNFPTLFLCCSDSESPDTLSSKNDLYQVYVPCTSNFPQGLSIHQVLDTKGASTPSVSRWGGSWHVWRHQGGAAARWDTIAGSIDWRRARLNRTDFCRGGKSGLRAISWRHDWRA